MSGYRGLEQGGQDPVPFPSGFHDLVGVEKGLWASRPTLPSTGPSPGTRAMCPLGFRERGFAAVVFPGSGAAVMDVLRVPELSELLLRERTGSGAYRVLVETFHCPSTYQPLVCLFHENMIKNGLF